MSATEELWQIENNWNELETIKGLEMMVKEASWQIGIDWIWKGAQPRVLLSFDSQVLSSNSIYLIYWMQRALELFSGVPMPLNNPLAVISTGEGASKPFQV